MKFLQGARRNPFLSNAFFIFIIRFFPSLANLLVISYYSRNLDTSLYGTYSNFWINLNLLYPLACLGIHVLIFTYPASQIVEITRRLGSMKIVVYGAWLFVIAVVFAIFQAATLNNYLLPFCFIIVYAVSIIFEAFLMIGKQFKLLMITNVLYGVFYWLIHKYVFQVSFSLQHLFSILLVLGGIKLLVYILATGKVFVNISRESVSLPIDVNPVRALWLHLALYDIIQNYSGWVDKFIVAHTLDSKSSGIYYNGSLNIPFLPLLLSAAMSAVLMQLSGNREADETPDILRLMNQAGRLLSCIVFPLFLFLVLYRYQVVLLLLSAKYLAAIPVFLVSLLIMPLRAYSFTSVLQRKHRGDIINKGAIAEIVLACLLIYPLYRLLGLPGVALSFIISSYLQAGFYIANTAKLISVKWWQLIPLGNWTLKLVAFSVVFLIVYKFTTGYFPDLISVILGTVFTMIVIVFSLWLEIKYSKDKHGTTTKTTEV